MTSSIYYNSYQAFDLQSRDKQIPMSRSYLTCVGTRQ
jgi:hypothetical protein